MININCKRDENGFYDIDGIDLFSHKIVMNTFSEKKDSFNFWCYPNHGLPFLVKYRNYPSYIFALYAELLYSGACKANGVKCADIDVGRYQNNYCVLSQDIAYSADEKLDAYGLALLAGVSQKEMLYDEKKQFREGFYADRLYQYALKVKEIFPELEIDKNFLLDLYKIAFLDLMFCQEDRNPTNIMFLIHRKGDRRYLSVAPIFDNEFAFEFMRLAGFYLHYKLDPVEVYNDVSQRANVASLFNFECLEVSKYATPIFGTTGKVERFRFPMALNSSDDSFAIPRRTASLISKKEYENMARVICENDDMRQFVEMFDADFLQIGKQIRKEQGFEIPIEYLELCDDIFSYNFKRLKNQIKKQEKLQEAEKGE